jgi:hypothetical protein
VALLPAVASAEPNRRIFTYREGEQARQVAQQECKPLVVHFVQNNVTGGEPLNSFYAGSDSVPKSLLAKVVIVAVPIEQYRAFAQQLGVTGPGGYRAISAYDLSTLDEKSQPTCRSGFV